MTFDFAVIGATGHAAGSLVANAELDPVDLFCPAPAKASHTGSCWKKPWNK